MGRNSSNTGTIITIVLGLVVSAVVFAVSIVMHVDMKANCLGHLERAANANTVPTALEELKIATSYLEGRGVTSGYTSIVYKTPDEDIGFWYKNLKASELELSKVTPETSQMEATNVLMKLRETLMDNGKSGSYVTRPDGIARYPHNKWLSPLLALCCTALIIVGVSIGVIVD